jgi:hypothetical protein
VTLRRSCFVSVRWPSLRSRTWRAVNRSKYTCESAKLLQYRVKQGGWPPSSSRGGAP